MQALTTLVLTLVLTSILVSGPVLCAAETPEDDRMERRDPQARPSELETASVWAREHLFGPTDRAAFGFVYGGRSSGEFLGSWERREATNETNPGMTERRVSYRDPATGLVCTCRSIAYRGSSAVEWVLLFENTGAADTPILERVRPLQATFARSGPGPITLHRSLGDSNSLDSFRPIEEAIAADSRIVLAPGGGRSSDPHLPFFNLALGTRGLAIAIGWSGQWEAEFAGAGDGAAGVRAGMQLTHLKLHPGESIRTPRILTVFWDGADPLRGNHLLRRTILERYAPRRNEKPAVAPICASVGKTDPDGTYEGPHTRPMKTMAARGIEVFWSDMDPQQWYPGGFPEGTGTWIVDPAKYPRGLKPVGDAAREAGLGYLLWFEPERVHFGTAIHKDHPEWVMESKGEWSQLFAFHIPEARAWITDLVSRYAAELGLSWIRWDFNIEPLGFWRRADALDRQGMTEIRYIEGLYAMWDELMARHPGLIIDQCASGGRRIDLESLTRGIPLWHSDLQCNGPAPEADQLQNAGLWRWLPMHGCGNFALDPAYAFRSAMTAGNILCVDTADPGAEPAVRKTVETYRALRPLLIGDFYPLLSHDASPNVWFAYQFHRPELEEGVVLAFRRGACEGESIRLKLRGLDPDARYEARDRETGRIAEASGRELMDGGLLVEVRDRPGSAIIQYRKS